MVVRFDPLWELDFNAVLIGCEKDLGGLDEEKLEPVRKRLKEIANELHFGFYKMVHDSGFRQEICSEINATIGQEIVTDIFFHVRRLTEYRPDDSFGQEDGE